MLGYDFEIDASILMLGGFWLTLVAFHLCCLMTDSALPLGNYSFPAVMFIVTGVLNIISMLVSAALYGMPLAGEGSEGWERLITGTAFLLIGGIHLIARKRSQKESE